MNVTPNFINQPVHWSAESITMRDRQLTLELESLEPWIELETDPDTRLQMISDDLFVVGPTTTYTSNPTQRVRLSFEDPIAVQIVDESSSMPDTYDVYETLRKKLYNNFSILTRSRYLDHVIAQHGRYHTEEEPFKHYQICTVDDIIDVISHKMPSVTILDK